MPQVFISYSRKDLGFVKALAKDLEESGLKVWYDVSDLEIGKRWALEIQVAIQESQYFIVILSPHSIVSQWVEREFIYAEKRKLKIIPVIIEHCELPLWAVSMQSINMAEMNYGNAIGELLKGMGINAGGEIKKRGLDAGGLPVGKKTARFSLAWILIPLLLVAISLGVWAILKTNGDPASSATATPPLASSNTPLPNSVKAQGRLFWNDKPAPGVELRMMGTGDEGTFLAVSDELGNYTFEVPPGNYVLHYRFPEEVDWTASQTTPHFTPYHYAEWPIVVEAGVTILIEDIHTIKEEDLKITYPDPHQELALPTHPTFEWEAYPSADHYMIWVYEMHMGPDTPAYSVPAGDHAETRGTSVTLDWAIPVNSDYYLWVIAYNVNDHELADGHAAFAVAEP